MTAGLAYTTVKKVHNLLTDYFRYLTQQEFISKNPMLAVPMIKRVNSGGPGERESAHLRNGHLVQPRGNHKVQG